MCMYVLERGFRWVGGRCVCVSVWVGRAPPPIGGRAARLAVLFLPPAASAAATAATAAAAAAAAAGTPRVGAGARAPSQSASAIGAP
eukprot:COSAG02_NODE_58936_length_276_cov_0.378531_1_plen_86_part_01